MAGKIGDAESIQMLENIFSVFGTAAAALIAVVVVSYLFYLDSPQKEYSVMFAGDLSFNDDHRSTWLIKNQDASYEKILLLYRTSDSSIPDIVMSSTLVDKVGKSIDSDNIKFNDQPVYSNNFVAGWNQININLNDRSLPPGSFEGRILVGGAIPESIPITISTKPLLFEAILLVIIGAMISVCIWEVVRHLKNKAKNKELVLLEQKLDVRDSTALVGPDREFTEINKGINKSELAREMVRNNSPRVTIPKLAVTELFAALLGVVVALFGVLYNENVTGVQVLDAYQVLVLVGIGLAAGSLKELVDKY